MCFVNRGTILTRIKKHKGPIKVYKLLAGEGTPPFRPGRSLGKGMHWYEGWNKDVQPLRQGDLPNNARAGRGLYAYRKKSHANQAVWGTREYVRVAWVMPEDVFGAEANMLIARRIFIGDKAPTKKS